MSKKSDFERFKTLDFIQMQILGSNIETPFEFQSCRKFRKYSN